MKQISTHSVTEMAGGVAAAATTAAAAAASEITRGRETRREMHFTAACDSLPSFHSP